MAIHTPLWLQKANEEDPDIEYPASEFRQLIADVFNEGILTGGAVSERGAGANFTVDVAVFRCVIDGDDGTDQGSYLVWSDAVENITVSAAPGSDSRIDLVVIEVNDEQAGGTGSLPFGRARVIAGTPAGSPSAPAVPDTAIGIATIGPITPATTSIEDPLITDIRSFADLRHDVVGPDSVDTAALQDESVTAAKLAGDALDLTWANLAYGSNWGAPDTSFQRMQYAKLGNTVFVQGGMKYSGTTGVTTLGTLPAGFRPPAGFSLSAFGVDDGDRCEIQSDGDIVASVTSGRNVFVNVAFPAA